MNFKNLEDKCLYYRGLTDYRILPNSNIIVMLDGKNFSHLIKNNFLKPFDDNFIDMMNKTAKFLCENVQGCKIAYTQSDEISLLITDYDTDKSDTLFGGRLCKIQSILASLATSEFNRQFILNKLSNRFSQDGSDVCFAGIYDSINHMKLAQFDCKVWVVPSQNDAFAWFLYRQIDCIRNSKQQTAQTWCSHKELLNLDTDEQISYLKEKHNVDWNSFDDDKKYGRFIYKIPETFSKNLRNKDGSFTKVTFDRNKFTIKPAFNLTDDGKEKFLKIIENEINKNEN